jgi:glycosyltransferase involved in cell wall biosynthesis
MIRIGNVIEEGRIGGPHLRIIQVGRGLKERGYATTVVHAARGSEALSAKIAAAGLQSRAVKLAPLNRGLRSLIYYAFTLIPDVWRLYRILKKERFDLVHCSGGAWQIKGVIAARLAQIPAVWHLNDTSTPAMIRRTFAVVARWARCDFIVAGQRVYEYYRLQRWPETKVWQIQAPVDTKRFDPRVVNPDPDIENIGGRTVVVIANVNRYKGLHVLIDAAGILAKQFSNLSFAVVGPVYESQKEYFESLVKRALELGVAEKVHFLGPKSDVPSALAAADIFVCTSITEASPMAVWEAMAMGRPIVSADVGDVGRFVENGKSGIVVPVGSASALADGIARYMEDGQLRSACGEEARRVAVTRFDIQVCIEKHVQCYRHTLRESGSQDPVQQCAASEKKKASVE